MQAPDVATTEALDVRLRGDPVAAPELSARLGLLAAHCRARLADAAPVPEPLELAVAPDEDERALALRLVATVLLDDPHPAGSAAVVAQGLLDVVSADAAGRSGAAEVEELQRRLEQGALPTLLEVMVPEESPPPGARVVAADLVRFLLDTRGSDALVAFARSLGESHVDIASEVTLGAPLADLETEWSSRLVLTPSGESGLIGFVRQSLRYMRPHRRLQMVVLAATLVTSGFTVLLPIAFKVVIDQAIVPEDLSFLGVVTIALAALFIANSASSLVKDYVGARVSARVLNDLRRGMFDRLQQLSRSFHNRADTGDLMSRMSSDLMVVDDAVSQLLPMTLSLLVSLVLSVGVLFTLEWRLAIAALLPLPLFVLGPMLVGPRAGRASMTLQQDTAAVATAVQESLSAHAVVQAFGLSSHSSRRFEERLDRLELSTVRARFLGALMGATGEFGMSLIQLLVLGGGGYLVIEGELALGSLVAFQALIGNVAAPIFSLSDLSQMLQQATGGLRRVEEVLEEPLDIADRPEAAVAQPLAREITFDGVSFSYDGESLTLADVHVAVPRGETVAVVGPSGAGKSTLVSLLLRFHDPDDGSVRIDGVDVRDVTIESLRARIGVVFQEPFLFNLSVRDNIELGRLGASEAEIEAAARAAEIHDDVLRLPLGYDTLVGERGGRLSGGQRQRVSLARALLRDPDLLLLDEPTSALDPGTEASVARTLERVAQGRTVVWVTHRLPTVQHADRIVVMQHGRVVETGRHDELLARDGLYRRLWDEQVTTGPASP